MTTPETTFTVWAYDADSPDRRHSNQLHEDEFPALSDAVARANELCAEGNLGSAIAEVLATHSDYTNDRAYEVRQSPTGAVQETYRSDAYPTEAYDAGCDPDSASGKYIAGLREIRCAPIMDYQVDEYRHHRHEVALSHRPQDDIGGVQFIGVRANVNGGWDINAVSYSEQGNILGKAVNAHANSVGELADTLVGVIEEADARRDYAIEAANAQREFRAGLDEIRAFAVPSRDEGYSITNIDHDAREVSLEHYQMDDRGGSQSMTVRMLDDGAWDITVETHSEQGKSMGANHVYTDAAKDLADAMASAVESADAKRNAVSHEQMLENFGIDGSWMAKAGWTAETRYETEDEVDFGPQENITATRAIPGGTLTVTANYSHDTEMVNIDKAKTVNGTTTELGNAYDRSQDTVMAEIKALHVQQVLHRGMSR